MIFDVLFVNLKAMVKLGGREDYPFYFGAGPELMRIAGDLRKSMTPAEKVLWERLRNRQVRGFRFRRQHPIKVKYYLELQLAGGGGLSSMNFDKILSYSLSEAEIKEVGFINSVTDLKVDNIQPIYEGDIITGYSGQVFKISSANENQFINTNINEMKFNYYLLT